MHAPTLYLLRVNRLCLGQDITTSGQLALYGSHVVMLPCQRIDCSSLLHRWAMAGVAGALGAELLGQGDWFEAPKWVSAALHPHTYHTQQAATS